MMPPMAQATRIRFCLLLALTFGLAGGLFSSRAGVTLITHGLGGDTDGWVSGMAAQIPAYARFPGTNFSTYKLFFVANGSGYNLTASRVSGGLPSVTDSGEIILKLDWSQLSDGYSYDTFQVAAAVVPALLNTNFLPELGGHALVEMPLHLIGHSRGGSLVCEISRLLGTNGVWVDHLTTLDPHPLNDPSFPFDFIFTAVDAPARTYSNVLFHDNYWQDQSSPIYGKAVPGAYIRKLTSFNGGYSGTGSEHSDVHLWYHGTVDWRIPASDTEATIPATERSNWWVAVEARGTNAGFLYSLLGGGDRFSALQPLGVGTGVIRDGYNQYWDLGAGQNPNRIALSTNNGTWANLLRLHVVGTNAFSPGDLIPVRLFYQWARASTNLARLSFFLDDDLNPYSGNEKLLGQMDTAGTTGSSVSNLIISASLAGTNLTPGWRTLFARLETGGNSRLLYAPESILILLGSEPPGIAVTARKANQIILGITGNPGQTIVLENSTDLRTWFPLATNVLSGTPWSFTNTIGTGTSKSFYRAARVR
jgi:hypothetical protein